MLSYLYAYLSMFCQDEEGQGMAEYGLIITLVALVAAVGFGLLGVGIDGLIGGITF